MPSVGATENAMLAACAAEGETVIMNAAQSEPEISELQSFLQKLGADVTGAGSATVRVRGRGSEPFPVGHRIMPDRIVSSTLLCACAAAGGDVELRGVVPGHFSTVLHSLSECGCDIMSNSASVRLRSGGNLRAPMPVITGPYPGFPTDAQPLLLAACLKAKGTSVFVENVFLNRFRFTEELQRLGARIHTEGRVAVVTGVDVLHGAPTVATDLRGGAALIIAALSAEGETDILDSGHVERGYESFRRAPAALGADIRLSELVTRRMIRWQSRRTRSGKRISAGSAAIGPAKFLLGCVVLIFLVSIFLQVGTIEVTGNSHYTAQEIIQAAGIEEGDNLFFINRFSAVSGIMAKLPVRGERRDSHAAARHGHNRDNREPGAGLGGAGGPALGNRPQLQGAHPGRQDRHVGAHTRERRHAGEPVRRRHASPERQGDGAGGDDPRRDARPDSAPRHGRTVDYIDLTDVSAPVMDDGRFTVLFGSEETIDYQFGKLVSARKPAHERRPGHPGRERGRRRRNIFTVLSRV